MEDGQKRKKAEYRSSIRSKMLIRNALVALMQEKPFEKITITDVVRRADINRGTFYAHYHDTGEVLEKIREEVVTDILGTVKLMTPDEIVADPARFYHNLGLTLEKNQRYYSLLISISGAYELVAQIRNSIVDYLLGASELMARGDQDYLRCSLDALVSAATQSYLDVITGRVDMDIDDATRLMVRFTSKLLG